MRFAMHLNGSSDNYCKKKTHKFYNFDIGFEVLRTTIK